ncbi:shikimate kinase [Gracilimonas tropica]|uniref:shikimate kinase n=1 Tax=Gracilimonas tropica TaxID=454600 RepID=UPI0003708DC9|nr:shikimate kinase [Gracilimonas tropica]
MNIERLKNFKQSIFITGFMASGKSTIGRMIAEKIGFNFIDLDAYIVEKEGSSINTLFSERGEAYFREKEWEYLLEITQTQKGVIALGGGALHNQRVVDHLKIHGLLLFIDTSMSKIVDRVASASERPVLWDDQGKIKSNETLYAELKTLYSKREKFYKQAQVRIETASFQTADEVAEAAIQKIARHV